MSRIAVASPKRTSDRLARPRLAPSTSAMTAATSSVRTIGFANCARSWSERALALRLRAARSARLARAASRPRPRASPWAGSRAAAREEGSSASAWTSRVRRGRGCSAWTPRSRLRAGRHRRASPPAPAARLPSPRARPPARPAPPALDAAGAGGGASTRACTGAAGGLGLLGREHAHLPLEGHEVVVGAVRLSRAAGTARPACRPSTPRRARPAPRPRPRSGRSSATCGRTSRTRSGRASPLIVSWMAFCASARFFRAMRTFFLRLASSILSLSIRSAFFSCSTAVFCFVHWSLKVVASSSCSRLRARASFASSSLPARSAIIARRSHSAAFAASCSELLGEPLLVGDRRGDLLLRLDELVVHVQDDLVQHLLGVFRAADQVVQVDLDELREAAEDTHALVLDSVRQASWRREPGSCCGEGHVDLVERRLRAR